MLQDLANSIPLWTRVAESDVNCPPMLTLEEQDEAIEVLHVVNTVGEAIDLLDSIDALSALYMPTVTTLKATLLGMPELFQHHRRNGW